VAPPGGSSRPPVRSSDGPPPVRGSGPSSEGVPSHHWRFFVSPVVVRVRPPPLPSFHPPSPPPPPLAPSPRRLPRVVACLRR
jgi:hypothetical protein